MKALDRFLGLFSLSVLAVTNLNLNLNLNLCGRAGGPFSLSKEDQSKTTAQLVVKSESLYRIIYFLSSLGLSNLS